MLYKTWTHAVELYQVGTPNLRRRGSLYPRVVLRPPRMRLLQQVLSTPSNLRVGLRSRHEFMA